jgi:signal transduction histidine kinase
VSRVGAGGVRRLVGSLRLRLVVLVTVLFAVTVSLASWFVVRGVEQSLLGDVRDEDVAQAERISAQLAAGADPDHLTFPPGIATAVRVIGPDGRVLAASPGSQLLDVVFMYSAGGGTGWQLVRYDLPPDGVLDERLLAAGGGSIGGEPSAGGSAPVSVIGTTEDGAPDPATADGVVVNAELPDEWSVARDQVAAPTGAFTVEVASPVDSVRESVDAVRRALWLGVPALVVAAGALAWIVAGRTLRSVDAITSTAERISGSTLDERLPVPPTDDEIAHLARTMNAMLDRIEASARRQREFVSDASHELRSPVATIRTEIEVALAHPERAEWSAVAEGVLAEDLRMEALLADLLMLARLEPGSGAPPGAAEPVDLAAVVHEVVARDREGARTAGPRVEVRGVRPAVVTGRPTQLGLVVRNLVDNARRHARTVVAVELTGMPEGGALLTVADDGPGVPESDRERVFERFVRLDEARSRADGGAGLGLAIVRAVVAAHGGTVRCTRAESGGARFEVRLPERARPASRGGAPTWAAAVPAGSGAPRRRSARPGAGTPSASPPAGSPTTT